MAWTPYDRHFRKLTDWKVLAGIFQLFFMANPFHVS